MATKKLNSTGIVIPVVGFSEEECLSINSLKDEIWEPIPLFNYEYSVSSLGRVKTNKHCIRWFNGYKECVKECPDKIRKAVLTTDGYLRITLYKKCSFFVHRLVALAFLGESELEVNHKNGNKLDNRLSNLEYVSRLENINHAKIAGLIKYSNSNFKGHLSNPKKFNKSSVEEIKRLFCSKKYTQKELASIFNVHRETIGRVIRGEKSYKEV